MRTAWNGTIRRGRTRQIQVSHTGEAAIRTKLNQLAQVHPITSRNFEAVAITWPDLGDRPESQPCPQLPPEQSPWDWLLGQIRRMVRQFQKDSGFGFGSSPWLSHAEERREAELARMRRNQQVAAQQQLERELRRAAREQQRLAEERARQDAARLPVPQAPLPPVPVRFEFPPIELQETALPLTNLNSFKLVEKAALWWVSNQTDSLLCLPYCRIERLEYQVRTALRVLGSLRGRALLSDEVGLGKY